jgi:hypothetical protein
MNDMDFYAPRSNNDNDPTVLVRELQKYRTTMMASEIAAVFIKAIWEKHLVPRLAFIAPGNRVRTVFTYPVSWDDSAKGRFRLAVERSGVEFPGPVDFETESVAACKALASIGRLPPRVRRPMAQRRHTFMFASDDACRAKPLSLWTAKASQSFGNPSLTPEKQSLETCADDAFAFARTPHPTSAWMRTAAQPSFPNSQSWAGC